MIWIWIAFIGFVLLMLALDLGVFHRHAHVISIREAFAWSAFWIALGLSFSVFIYFAYQHHWFGLGSSADAVDGLVLDGPAATVKYLTGYIVEKSLSVDNIFVMALIFAYFAIPAIYQHRVLFWGIVGALLMRGAMIALGVQLIATFHWILYVFGGFLVLTGLKMLVMKSEEAHPDRNPFVRLARRLFPVTACFHGKHFLVRAGSPASREGTVPGQEPTPDEKVEQARPGLLMLTPLAIGLIVVETTDVIFAVDSIPAVFAITADPFLVFTSNVFAILGLRSLYFALAGMIDKFRYLKASIALILVMVGAKMLAADWIKGLLGQGANFYLLGMILLILACGVGASLLAGDRLGQRPAEK